MVLTRADTYPDALAGVPLAAKVGGPLLLTSSNSLSAAVRAEIVRVLPAGAPVYILGGTSAVSAAVETTITGLGFVVHRLAGANRFATAVAVAGALGNPTTVFEATGLNFPDALAGGPAAIEDGAAILLTNGSRARGGDDCVPGCAPGRRPLRARQARRPRPTRRRRRSPATIATRPPPHVAETFFHTPDGRRCCDWNQLPRRPRRGA